MAEPRPANRTRPGAWLVTTVSLTVVAFGATVVLAPRGSETPVRALAWLVFLGSSVHVASTGWLFTLPEVRAHAAVHRIRYVAAPIILVVVGGSVASRTAPSQLAWLLLPYFCWQFFHFQKQNLGLSALAATSHGARSLTGVERGALVGSGGAGILGLVAHPGLLQLPRTTGITVLSPVATFGFAAAALVGLVSLWRRAPDDRPPGFSVMYLVALFFSLPVFVFGSPYAAVGGMTVAHGLQYLLLVGLVAAGTGRGTTRAVQVAALGTVALTGGALLGGASHLHRSGPAGRFLFGMYLGVVMAHFVVDAGLWRLRDEFPRAFLRARLPFLVPPVPARPPVPATDRSVADL